MSIRRWMMAGMMFLALDRGLAGAAVDASGPWFASLGFSGNPLVSCRLEFDTTSDLVVTGACDPFLTELALTGQIDTASGAFSATGPAGSLCESVGMQGEVAPDGRTFSATLDCVALGIPLELEGSRCGNGRIDVDETCDDGNRQDGDCCTSQCDLIPDGGACDDQNSCTVSDRCESGHCAAETLPNGSACDDGTLCTAGDQCADGYCRSGDPITCADGCETCVPSEGCVLAPSWCGFGDSGRMIAKDAPGSANDALTVDLTASSWFDASAFGDPRVDTSYDLCVYDPNGLVARVSAPAGGVCGGKPCWTKTGNGFRYRSRQAGDLAQLAFRLRESGKISVRLRAKGSGMTLERLPEPSWAIAELRGSNGACAGTPFFRWPRVGPRVVEGRGGRF